MLRVCTEPKCCNFLYGRQRKFCCSRCKRRNINRRWEFNNREKVLARYNSQAYRSMEAERSRQWRADPNNRDIRRSLQRQRRARKNGASVIEDVRLSVLRTLYNDICYLCDGEVVEDDSRLRPTHDHIIPLSRGGDHSYDNAGLAHHSCNVKKGTSILPTKP